jgi:hypothetical protein
MRLGGIEAPELVIVRTLDGIDPASEDGERLGDQPIHATFFLVSPEGDASQHLRFLAQLAVRVEEPDFMTAWTFARDEGALREILLRGERSFALTLQRGGAFDDWIGHTLAEIDRPPGCLVALLRRGNETLVPGAGTRLSEGDRLMLIGDPAGIRELRERS